MIKKYSSEITTIYDDLQKKAKDQLEQRRKEISKVLPEVIEIDNKIAKLCIDVSINTLKQIENRDLYLSGLQDQITDLKIKKSELLVSKGYPMDYLLIHYQCNKCKDTGYIGTTKCECYKRHIVKLHYSHSDLKDILKIHNFSNFSLDLYDDFRVGKEPLTPKKNMQQILFKVKNFINNFPHSKENLFFYGNSGIGKTFLSYCIAKELMDRGHFVVYRTSDDLVKELKEIRFKDNYELEDILLNCELLIIDDLGTEPLNDISRTELFNIINKRLLKNKSMLISSNLPLESILQNYTERLTSRLLGNFTLCKFYGEDIRVKLNLRKNPLSL